MQIKTIVVDLDRTLLHTDKTISPYTAAVLKECKNRGMGILVATARPLRTTIPFCEWVDFDALVVSNGARVVWGDQQKDCGICTEQAVRILEALGQHPDLWITLETGDRDYSNRPVPEFASTVTDDLPGIARSEGALKILVHLNCPQTLEIVKSVMTEDLYYTVAHGYLLQIMHKAATKWTGIQAMLALCGSTPTETVYFGDDQDDMEPLKFCGIGVAVANGIDEAKAAADYITESNDADGVAKFIEQHILA